ncbi:MAG TPA: ATP-binding cassette domain-containing protein [Gemmatimonadaceae bacterium]|nr:ATP-binding cassette domain-containing protein [Gemmatimonadaceae bacterium]
MRSLSARAGAFTVHDVSLVVPRGQWGVVTGPAGAGKTTLLETIAGIRRATQGMVLLRGVPVTALPPERRRVGIVYQRGFLFPHLSVGSNVAYGASDASYAAEIGRRFGADRLADRRVAALSGGERQIVALARALATRPDILLLDEPFSALDQARKGRVREELGALHREEGFTVLQVTHDLAEAAGAGVRVEMEEGRVVG